MPHTLRRMIPRRSDSAPSPAPDIPLLHPLVSCEFTWGGRSAAIHAQRKAPGSLKLHGKWFFLRLPDGSFHEIQFTRLRSHLEHPPGIPTTIAIAHAFEQESDQSPESLAGLARACGI